MKPSEEFKTAYDFWRKIPLISGVDVSGKIHFSFGFWTTIAIVGLWFTSMIYPSYLNWPDVKGVLVPLTHISVGCLGVIRLLVHMWKPKGLINFKTKMEDYLKKYEGNKDLEKSLKFRMRQSKVWINTITILNLMFYSIHLIFLSVFIISGRQILAVPIQVPFTDNESTSGYLTNLFTSQAIALVGFIANACYEVLFIFIGIHGSSIVDVMCYKLRKLSEIILAGERDEAKLKKSLTEIIVDYEAYQDHLEGYFDYFKLNNMFAVFSVAFPVCVNVLLVLTSSNKLISIIGLLSTLHMFIFCFQPCLMGTIISGQNQRMLQKLCELPFYDLPIKEQKIYLQFILVCQNSKELKAPIMEIFSLELMTTVLNTCYTYFMFIWNCVAK